jgi:hypothetical protein
MEEERRQFLQPSPLPLQAPSLGTMLCRPRLMFDVSPNVFLGRRVPFNAVSRGRCVPVRSIPYLREGELTLYLEAEGRAFLIGCMCVGG